MAQPIEDEYGIVTENARRRSVFSKYIERRVEDYLTSPGGRARLAREIERVQAKLENASFTSKAPPPVIAKERAKLGEYTNERDALQAQLLALVR